jgi:hypothetical protein
MQFDPARTGTDDRSGRVAGHLGRSTPAYSPTFQDKKDEKGSKMRSFFLTMAVATACLCGASGLQMAAAQSERECKSDQLVRTGGTADTEVWARKRARDAWRQMAEEKFGDKWSAWYMAKDHDYNCFTENGKNRCTAKAVPCRSTVVVQGPRKICGFYVISATGEAAEIEEWAKHKARAKWSERAGMLVGDDFDTWLLANNRSVTCKNAGNGKEICTAKATPCRFSIIN